MTAQVTMLTDEQAAIAAARKYAVSLDQPKTNEYHIRVDGFVVGARFARDRYEARLAEDAKVRAQLVASLQNLVAAICKVQDWDGTRVGSALDDVDAALAAAKERG